MTMAMRLPIRLPRSGEHGIEFIHWLDRRVNGNRLRRERLVSFIQQWDHARDEVREREGRELTVELYAEYWNVSESSAFRILSEFRNATGIDYPGQLCDLLWDAMPHWTGRGPVPRPKWLLAVEIVPVSKHR
jgi:hypothetical protein